MGDVVPFKRPAKTKPKKSPGAIFGGAQRGPGGLPPGTAGNKKGLCQHGYHKWKVVKDTEFDSKQGRLVTRYRCERCGKEKVEGR